MAKSLTDLKVGESIDFHYQKSSDYRTIHVDGAYGGITPRGYITVTFYNERGTIPRRSYRAIENARGPGEYQLGSEVVSETLGGIMRQLETTVFMDLNTAREFHAWFGKKLEDLEKWEHPSADPGTSGTIS